MALEKLVQELTTALHSHLPEHQPISPGRYSLWLRLVKPGELDGSIVDLPMGPAQKLALTVKSRDELLAAIAENALVTVYGAEVPLVKTMPNLIVKLLERKARVPVAGAPPIDAADQPFLKVTVYRFEPSLWERLMGQTGEE
ncbi:MAG TPA: hypothetical protein VK191_01545 [Symbiobacteriaceae bacterium]|nr:hypothetical protein [Symbiobacteriaceae bacterium]